MFRSRLRIPRLPVARPVGARKRLHTMPSLSHDFSEGVPELLSRDGFSIAWSQYQGMVLQKLNELTVGTDLEQKSTIQILTETARSPQKAAIFNYASMAHNNHFFFENLSPSSCAIPPTLEKGLENSFGSIETLRREMVMTANAMFGPGFVWLVMTATDQFAVLPTYLAGSPYPQAHWRKQEIDMNTTGADGTAESFLVHTQARGIPRKGGPWAVKKGDQTAPPTADSQAKLSAQAPQAIHSKALPPGGTQVTPLLCVNTWEHVWLRDYAFEVDGIGGKREFLERWWHTVDWVAVADRAENAAKAMNPQQSRLDKVATKMMRNQRPLGKPETVVRGSEADAQANMMGSYWGKTPLSNRESGWNQPAEAVREVESAAQPEEPKQSEQQEQQEQPKKQDKSEPSEETGTQNSLKELEQLENTLEELKRKLLQKGRP